MLNSLQPGSHAQRRLDLPAPRMIKVQRAFAKGKEKFADVETTRPFQTAIIDPDWPYTAAPGVADHLHDKQDKGRLSGFTRNKGSHERNIYSRDVPLTIDELKALPVGDVIGGYVLLWTVGPFLINGSASALLTAWGFEPASILTWAKYDLEAGHGYGGVGYWFLGNAEFCVVGKRPGWPSIRTGKSSLIIEKKRGHSDKPSNIHDLCEQRFPGAYLEIFGRTIRAGWEVIGDEVDGKDVRETLARLAAKSKRARLSDERAATEFHTTTTTQPDANQEPHHRGVSFI